MALATKCPQCSALFRVVADQLKLRGGLVRCGQCRAVFDAIGSLTYVDDAALAQTRTITALTKPLPPPAASSRASRTQPTAPSRRGPRTRPAHANTGPSKQALGPATTLRIAPTAPATLANVSLRRSAPLPAAISDRKERAGDDEKRHSRSKRERAVQEEAEAVLGVPTLIAPGGRERVDASSIVDGIEVIELAALPAETEARPSLSTRAPAAEEEPEFIRSDRSRVRRGFSIIFGGGSVLLAALIAVQLAIIFRSELLARVPQARDALVQLCAVFGCAVGWPTQVDQLAVIGSELQTIPGTDVLELTAVVRNRAGFRQALPAVEVTLTDSLNRPIARKVFTPADYLAAAGEPSSRIEDGLGSGSDYTIRLFFEARGVQAAGFLVYPFFI
ncbi:MAG: zinc-ribbon domain-containing protein [Pseudomonadota bacterium]|nr:zinc-ribbon domain-containing protein [Burkholderiaceae bacterium]MDQ3446534.1 zinc-ribbon domain-containing protein [Pseudomonadota bacterium]